ncbi:unnamed protein product [Psylliodes chrysocephalus]|uniref:SCP domain-containing protein n=1 Tax=Psylliodes chrysocephalus TaxID=3402493 RepID=A0A9P0D3R2_9CUCU|nr:unnamed protein product [Psylliodes chrysocephala]
MAKLIILFLMTVIAVTYIVFAQADYCQMSCKLNNQLFTHIICQRKNMNCGAGPDCGSSFNPIDLTEEDKQLILDVHNELRNKVATGQETIGNQPPASNMNALSYNEEIATFAQCHSNECQFKHDKCRRTAEWEWVGQNLEKKFSSDGNVRVAINASIHNWYREVKSFSSSWINTFAEHGVMIGHYTQLVWAESKYVGCGLTNYLSGDLNYFIFACNYGPGGNVAGASVYKIGSPATDCPGGESANPNYQGLCGSDDL